MSSLLSQTKYDPDLANHYLEFMNFNSVVLYYGNKSIVPYSYDTNFISGIKYLSLQKHNININFDTMDYTVRITPDHNRHYDIELNF